MKKATFDGIIKLTQLLKNDNKNFNPHAELLSIIQKTISRKIYLDFDVDFKDFDFNQLKDIINLSCMDIVETRGGYHLLVKLKEIEKQYKKTFYQKITALGVDQTGDQLLPVPGCVQGGFVPRFIKR